MHTTGGFLLIASRYAPPPRPSIPYRGGGADIDLDCGECLAHYTHHDGSTGPVQAS
jgi:hypothetical protein